MAWPLGGLATDQVADDEDSRERLLAMAGISIEEVPLPDTGELGEDEAWTISPGPARARIGATDVAVAVQMKTPTNVQASVDTSSLERLVSSRLDTVEDTLRGVESRLLEQIPNMTFSEPSEESEDSEEGEVDEDSMEGGDRIITASGEIIEIGADNQRLMAEDSAPLLELYEAQALSVNPFLASREGLGELAENTALGAHTVAALLLDHLSGMAAASFVAKAKASGMMTESESRAVQAIIQLAAPGEPDAALQDHLPDRELLTLSTLVTAWRKSIASAQGA